MAVILLFLEWAEEPTSICFRLETGKCSIKHQRLSCTQCLKKEKKKGKQESFRLSGYSYSDALGPMCSKFFLSLFIYRYLEASGATRPTTCYQVGVNKEKASKRVLLNGDID